MPSIVPKSLKGRMIALFLLVSLVPVAIVTAFSFFNSREVLMETEFKKLSAEVETKKEAVTAFFRERIVALKTITSSPDFKESSLRLTRSIHDLEQRGNGLFDPESDDYRAICSNINPLLQEIAGMEAYRNTSLIWGKSGLMFFTTGDRADMGKSLIADSYKKLKIAGLWEKVHEDRTIAFTDMFVEKTDSDGEPAMFVAAPLPGEKGAPLAVIVLEVDITRINAIVQEGTGLGNSGETYIVGDDLLMRSGSRFERESTILKKRVDTATVHQAFENEEGTALSENCNGKSVLSAYARVGLTKDPGLDFDWVVVSDISTAEAFSAMNTFGLQILCGAAVLVVLVCLAGYFAAKMISRPMEGLTSELAHMASEISSTASQLAAGAAETSTSIAEITTTVEEVRQTAHLSNEKSRKVADRAGEVALISENGKEYTENAADGMTRIREEMEYVAESIIKLSEQTQSIGEIIGTVNDLADQSNLLSVNASIEAAKAGEYGKGFAVVAQEVKSLADQSKKATEQVRTILNDIQNATSTSVMATERGSKAVESGVDLSSKAGDSISVLATSVKESENAATQIASSSQEQLVGIDQLADSMESIKAATSQNVQGAKQLAGATSGLNELGQQMKQLTGS